MNFVVYKITNLINNKIYVGKTKEFYGKTKFGINGRLKNHIICAFSKSKKNDCPYLYNAIRKYGKDNFKIEELEKTMEDNINDREVFYINKLNSSDSNIGYNIALGGGGRTVTFISEETRYKISKAQDPDGITNIKPYFKNNKIIGYYVKRRIRGKVIIKYFTSTKNLPDNNFKFAQDFLEKIKRNDFQEIEKKNTMENIHAIKDKKDKNKIIGYRVNITRSKKKISKSFQNKSLNLDELLKNAIDFKKIKLSECQLK